MFRNKAGRRFRDVTASGGVGHLQKGHAISFGDIDNDGDQDIFVKMGGAHEGDAFRSALFENPGHGNHWLTLVLDGVRANRGAIARVRAAGRYIHYVVGSGGSFGAKSVRAEIEQRSADRIDEVEIRWPGSGTVQRFRDLQPDRSYRLHEGDSRPQSLRPNTIRLASR